MELLSPHEYKLLRKVRRSFLVPLPLDSLNTYDRNICVGLCEKDLLEDIGIEAVVITEKGRAILRERTLKISPILISAAAIIISIVSLVLSIVL